MYAKCAYDKDASPWALLEECARGSKVAIKVEAGDKEAVVDRIISIAEWAISLGALLAVGAIVWAGIQYTKSLGDDEKLKKAKTTGVYALIGLILLLMSFGLVDIFINFIYSMAGSN
jgi:hypothetical protein